MSITIINFNHWSLSSLYPLFDFYTYHSAIHTSSVLMYSFSSAVHLFRHSNDVRLYSFSF